MHYFGIVGLAFLLVSCGSYQYAGYEEDAIYGESGYEVEYVERVQTGDVNTDPDNGYYKNYFKEKALQYEAVSESDAVFTDIDSYEGNYEEENDSIRYTEGYAGWGQDHNQDVSINIYGGGLYNNIWWNRPIGWNWGWNYGYPYGYGWNNWGWNNWGWNVGIGWNNWDPFWCPPYYGWGGFYGNQWAYGWGGAFYGSGYYGRRVAYTNSRRSPLYSSSGMASVGRRSSLNTNYSSRRGSVNNSAVRPNSRVRPEVSRSRPSSSRTRPAVGTNSRVKPSATVRPGTKPRVRPNSKPRTRPTSTVKPRSGNSKPVYRSRPSSTKRNNRSYNNNNRSRSNNRSSNFSRSSSSRSSSFSRSSGGSTRSSGSRSGGSRRGGRM